MNYSCLLTLNKLFQTERASHSTIHYESDKALEKAIVNLMK